MSDENCARGFCTCLHCDCTHQNALDSACHKCSCIAFNPQSAQADPVSPALDALAREDEQEWRDMVTGATLAAQATEAELAEAQALVLDGEATVAALRLRLTEAEAAFRNLFGSISSRTDPWNERLLCVPDEAYDEAKALASRPVPPAHDRQEKS